MSSHSASTIVLRMIKRAIRLCRITGPMEEGASFPRQQISYLGRVGNSIPWFGYGEHANVPETELEESVLLTYGGLAENRIHLSGSMRARPRDLAKGEKVSFCPVTGSEIRYKADRSIVITAPEVVFSGNVTINGNLTVLGETALGATVTSNGKDISDTHTHGGSATAPTGPVSPTGVPV